MLLYDLNDDHRHRQADFERRRSGAEAVRKSAEAMTDLLDGTTEPSSDDVMLLHDPAVDPSLRASIIDARKRMGSMTREQRFDYMDAIAPVSAAITKLGPDFAPLRRLISPSSFADGADSAISPVASKLAKYDSSARTACDLNFLVDVRIPAPIRRRLLDAKHALDAAPPSQRRLLSKSFAGSLSAEVAGLARTIGTEGVAALRRVLEL